ncbi:TetR/AcrR family transcriptional regulator [Actinotalea sp. K2]|uniref:TetR/AcrR family transcriptional regulator n=1 Tax=Actinotalea sp. K2 TaxID=2939438 RepID=UPI002017208B|nr:TetR/AcrR family transcriptional regulator [Actinotalea sp. K2]MCL3860258.1 TetR/AcrR family transcriptional regulator [Actinotalea sp. K2]
MQESSIDNEPMGLRERKKRACREALIDASHRLVSEHGLDAVTVEAICSEAGVSTRTFFNYFESKDDAVLAVAPWTLDPQVVETFAAGGPNGRLGADLEFLVTGLVDRPPMGGRRIACAMELARREPRLLGRQVAAFEQHHESVAQLVTRRLGPQETPARVEMLTLLVLSITRAAFVHWEAEGQHGQVRDVVPAVMTELRNLLRDD